MLSLCDTRNQQMKNWKKSLKLGRPKKLVVIQMVNYFYGTKKDPIDFNDELLKKELVNGVSRIISFFKK